MTAKILTWDVESYPLEAFAWSLWDKNIPLAMMKAPGRISCFAAKWHSSRTVMFFAEWQEGGHEGMVRKAHSLLDEADISVTFNGKKYDVPRMNRELVRLGLTPPSPRREVDLYQVVARNMKFQSNRLGYVAAELGLEEQKGSNEGFNLWRKCMAGDAKAQAAMARYCKQDVRTTEALYDRLLPWIPSHPHLGLYTDDDNPVCGQCGKAGTLQRRGFAVTTLGKFQRWQCQSCSAWSRGKRSVKMLEERVI